MSIYAAELDRRLDTSTTAGRCDECGDQVQTRRFTDGSAVLLEVYATHDGTYSVMADCETVYRTDMGVARYRRHRCEGDE